MEMKPFTFGILAEKTPATEEDQKTKLPPGVYHGFFVDDRQLELQILAEMEDEELYIKNWREGNAIVNQAGYSLLPMTREEREARGEQLRKELGLGRGEAVKLLEEGESE